MKTNTIVRIVAFVIMILAVIFQVIVMVNGDDAIEASATLQDSLLSPYMYLSYVAIVATAAIAVILSLFGVFNDKKKTKNSLIGFGALVIISLVSYLLADGSDANLYVVENVVSTESEAKNVGAGLIAFYLLAGAAVLSIVYVEVSKLFNR